MRFRFSALSTKLSVVVTVMLISSVCWAHYYELGPSKDEWGLKYDAEVTAAEGDKLNVRFTLADQGRLKPIYSVSVVAFSDLRPGGGRTYLLNSTIELKHTQDGKLSGQVQISKELTNRAMIRIMTLTFDGQYQAAGARYYQMPVTKFMKKAAAPASSPALPSIASQPGSVASQRPSVASQPESKATK